MSDNILRSSVSGKTIYLQIRLTKKIFKLAIKSDKIYGKVTNSDINFQ